MKNLKPKRRMGISEETPLPSHQSMTKPSKAIRGNDSDSVMEKKTEAGSPATLDPSPIKGPKATFHRGVSPLTTLLQAKQGGGQPTTTAPGAPGAAFKFSKGKHRSKAPQLDTPSDVSGDIIASQKDLSRAPQLDLPSDLSKRPFRGQKQDLLKRSWPGHWQILYPALFAFFLPIVIMLLAYCFSEVFPFGERHILTVDLYHQYAPFLSEYKRILQGNGSLLFSWSGGMGVSFLPLFAYYLASPLNLILAAFPDYLLSEGVLTLTILKISLASLSFFFYQVWTKGKRGMEPAFFSLCYALCNYVMAYSWNIMWLDSVVALPMVIATLIHLIRTRKMVPFALAVFAATYMNFYTGFFVCVFTALYFPVLLVQNTEYLPRVRDYFLTLGRTALASFTGVVMSAFLLVPTILALQNTSATGDDFPKELLSFFDPFINLIAQVCFGGGINVRSGMANLYVSIAVVLLIPLFFAQPRIKSSIKVANAILLAFLVFSLNNRVFDFLWHGAHYPNQLDHRYAFVLAFLLVSLMADAYPYFSEVKPSFYAKVFGAFTLLIFLLQKMDKDLMTEEMVVFSFLFLGAYTLIIFFTKFCTYRLRTVMLGFLLVVELTLSSIMSIHQLRTDEFFGLRKSYKAGVVGSSIEQFLDYVKPYRDPSRGLERVEKIPHNTANDAFLYGLGGISVFSSTYPKEPTEAMAQLGFPTNHINSFEYRTQNAFIDSLLGVKYVIACYEKDKEVAPDLSQLRQLWLENGETKVYLNPYALPLTYFASSDVVYCSLMEGDSFEAQESLARSILGDNSRMVFEYCTPTIESSPSCTVSNVSSQEMMKLKVDNTDPATGTITLTFVAEKDGNYAFAYRERGIDVDRCSAKLVKTKKAPLDPFEQEILDNATADDALAEFGSSSHKNRLPDKKDQAPAFAQASGLDQAPGQAPGKVPGQVLPEPLPFVSNPPHPAPNTPASPLTSPKRFDGSDPLYDEDPGQGTAIAYSTVVPKEHLVNVDLGFAKAGETFEIELQVPGSKQGNIDFSLVYLNADRMRNILTDIGSHSAHFTAFGPRSFSCTLDFPKNGYFFNSITYDEGWKAYVDGRPTEIEKVAKAFMAIPATEGTHELRMVYTPKGFHEGLLLSAGGLILLGILFLFDRFVNPTVRRAAWNVPDLPPIPPQGPADLATDPAQGPYYRASVPQLEDVQDPASDPQKGDTDVPNSDPHTATDLPDPKFNTNSRPNSDPHFLG